MINYILKQSAGRSPAKAGPPTPAATAALGGSGLCARTSAGRWRPGARTEAPELGVSSRCGALLRLGQASHGTFGPLEARPGARRLPPHRPAEGARAGKDEAYSRAGPRRQRLAAPSPLPGRLPGRHVGERGDPEAVPGAGFLFLRGGAGPAGLGGRKWRRCCSSSCRALPLRSAGPRPPRAAATAPGPGRSHAGPDSEHFTYMR